MKDHPPTPADWQLPLEERPRLCRRFFWFGLAVMWLYAAVFLLFGLIDRWAPPANERANDGTHASYFVVDQNPYYTFSEDFHLYDLRAKRIAVRGWTDSPLWSREGARTSTAAPLQALLMRLAVLTDGRPMSYAFFMTGGIGVAWTILYLVATRCIHGTVSPLAPPIALAFTLLFESIDGLWNPVSDYGQWPVHRGLRMATLAWSNPLILAMVIAAVSLLFRPAKPRPRIALIAGLLAIFAAADTWSFLLGSACLGVVACLLIILGLTRRRMGETFATKELFAAAVGVTLALAAAVAVNHSTAPHFNGDVMTRAGFGPQWKESPAGITHSPWIRRQFQWRLFEFVAIVAVASIYARAGLIWRRGVSRISVWAAPPSERRWSFVALAAVPMGGLLVVAAAMSILGMDLAHVDQFVWRANMMFLFALTLVLTELAKLTTRHTATRFGVAPVPWEFAGAAALLAALWGYHVVRTNEFARRIPAHEAFLTADEEALRDWLVEFGAGRERFTLATASHELNLLAAFWTDADMLLPEGFPYHSAETNAEIETRAARLLALYQTTPERWLEFNLFREGWDQVSWAQSRLLSARQGYMYYLLHRATGVHGHELSSDEEGLQHRTTADLARRLDEGAPYVVHIAAVESAKRIAKLLENPPAVSLDDRPNVILIDEVSRFLGEPNLDGYERAFQHGKLEAWVWKM